MIEKYQGYTAVRKVGQGFRPVGKHPFRIIHNTRVIKFDLIQQFEDSTNLTQRSEKQLMHATSADSRQTTCCDEITNKGK